MFRLATPVGQLADESDEPQVIEEPPVQAKPQPLPLPVARPRRRKAPPPQSPQVLLASLIFAFFVGMAVGAFFLVRHLAAPEVAEPEVAAPAKPVPVEPVQQPEPPLVEKKDLPAGKPPEVKPPVEPVPPPPAPVRPAAPVKLHFDGPVLAIHASGSGRYVVFQITTPRQLVVYDLVAEKVTRTIEGLEINPRVAVGREKMFVGRSTDGQITRYDLRTGAQELTGGVNPPERLTFLTMGSNSDGPLVGVTSTAAGKYVGRLFSADDFMPLETPIEEPNADGKRTAFPVATISSAQVAVSADGRAIALSNQLYTRTATGYRVVQLQLSTGLRLNSDGTLGLGIALVGDDGRVVRTDERELRRFLPAANGPLFLSAEYRANPVRLMLHAENDPKPLGELLTNDHLTDVFQKGLTTTLFRHLVFLPEPGLVVFAATGSRDAHLVPVDLSALLAKAGRDVMFTSVPPATVPENRRYTYTATAVARNGEKPKFELESGPPGMTVTADGQLTWAPDAAFKQSTADVRLIARTADGKRTVQQFRLFVPLKW